MWVTEKMCALICWQPTRWFFRYAGELKLAPEHHTFAIRYLAEPSDTDSIQVSFDTQTSNLQPQTSNPLMVVLTGGEPLLYADEALVDAFHEEGCYVAIETNGTRPMPTGVDWVTLSPKDCFVSDAKVVLEHADEVKLVFDGTNAEAFERYSAFPATRYYLQPCDTGNPDRNSQLIESAVSYCLTHPQWSLSLQLHKMIGIQ